MNHPDPLAQLGAVLALVIAPQCAQRRHLAQFEERPDREQCGRTRAEDQPRQYDGRPRALRDFQWHVGTYQRRKQVLSRQPETDADTRAEEAEQARLQCICGVGCLGAHPDGYVQSEQHHE